MPRSGIMLAHPFEESRLARWGQEGLFIQPKLDGERLRVIVEPPSVFLLSSEENIITSVPHIESAIRSLNLPPHTELDGEIYLHGMNFSEIHSRRGRTKVLHDDYESLEFHIFDLVNSSSQIDRLAELHFLLRNLDPSLPLKLVPTALINPDISEILSFLEIYYEDGYEGIILRHPQGLYERKRSHYLMKFKPHQSDTYEIVDYREELSKNGTPKNSLGALICRGSDGTLFGVGSGFTSQQRKDYWDSRESLIGQQVLVKYQQVTPKHVPRFPIFCEVVPMVNGLPEENMDGS